MRKMTGRVWMSFGVSGVRVLRLVFFKPIPGLEAQDSAGDHAYLGRGRMRIRRRRLGGKSAREVLVLAGCTRSVDVMILMLNLLSIMSTLPFHRCSCFVGGSSLSLMFLKESGGFTQSRFDALCRYWGAVCRHGPCGPVQTLEPWVHWTPPDLHGFRRWVMDAVEQLNGFVKQVVIARRDTGLLSWVIGYGRILAPGRMLGFGRILPPSLPFSGYQGSCHPDFADLSGT